MNPFFFYLNQNPSYEKVSLYNHTNQKNKIMIPKKVIEYSIVGKDVEEHNIDYETAKDIFNNLSISKRKAVQFFKKVWIFNSETKGYDETDVVLFSSYKGDEIK